MPKITSAAITSVVITGYSMKRREIFMAGLPPAWPPAPPRGAAPRAAGFAPSISTLGARHHAQLAVRHHLSPAAGRL